MFEEGDACDGLYLVSAGSVSVVTRAGQRFVSVSPGGMLGEAALLDGGWRSGSAVADEPSQLLQLTPDALAALQRDQPALAAALYRNIARHLAQRLRVATVRRPPIRQGMVSGSDDCKSDG